MCETKSTYVCIQLSNHCWHFNRFDEILQFIMFSIEIMVELNKNMLLSFRTVEVYYITEFLVVNLKILN